MAEAVGAFMVCAALITLAGATGWFERAHEPACRWPSRLALLAGVLARFGLQAFAACADRGCPWWLLMLASYRAWQAHACPATRCL